ncbi:hypothetical protein B0E43_11865 [Algoriphagus sp. A40]|nr:hypothetical protein B0E43_11865 [Algoriphagus sp. A40]
MIKRGLNGQFVKNLKKPFQVRLKVAIIFCFAKQIELEIPRKSRVFTETISEKELLQITGNSDKS